MAGARRTKHTYHLLRAAAQGQAGVFGVQDKARISLYVFEEIPCHIGGRGFAVRRIGSGPVYHLRIGAPEECSCECMGFLRQGHCKHLSALQELVRPKNRRHPMP
jgi:hypothetical protein